MTFAEKWENPVQLDAWDEPKLRAALKERNDLMKTIMAEGGHLEKGKLDHAKVQVVEFKDSAELATYMRNLNDELTLVGEKITPFDESAKWAATAERWSAFQAGFDHDPTSWAPGSKSRENRPETKSLGAMMAQPEILAAHLAERRERFIVEDFDAKSFLESKTVFSTGAGWAPETISDGRLVLDAQRGIELTDLFPIIPTKQAAAVYWEETTFTNAAAGRAEGAAYAESAFALTKRSVTIEVVGSSIPATDEQLADVPEAEAYLNQRLGFAVKQKTDSELINGDGSTPNVRGTLNVSGIQTQALGTDAVPDAIYKALDLVEVTGRSNANVVIINNADWQGIRLLRTADGVYIWGSPADEGPMRIWGLPVVKTSAIAQGTALVGDYARHSAIYSRRGLVVETGYVNDDFLDGRITIRAGLRLAPVHFRPEAFAKVTGLPA